MRPAVAAVLATPASVKLTTIGAICDQFGGAVQTGPFGSQLHASDYTAEGTPVVMPQDMTDGQILSDAIARVGEKHVVRLAQHQLKVGDIVFSRRGDVSRFAVVGARQEGWLCGTGSIRIRLNCPEIDIKYLRRFLQQDSVGAWLLHHAKGVTMPNLNTEVIRAIPFVYPSLGEQRRIAAVLDQADDLRCKRRAALNILSTLPQIIFDEMFGDWSPPRFNGSLIDLGTRVDFLTSGSRGWAKYYRNAGSLFLRIQNVRHDELDLNDVAFVAPPQTAEARRTKVQPGDVLLSITADLGRTAVVPSDIGDAYINQHLSILRSSKLEPRYLSAALSSRAGQIAIQKKNREGVKAGLNFDDVRTLKIPDADRIQQRAYASRVAEIDKLKAEHRAHLAKLDSLFASLQHRAFRGV